MILGLKALSFIKKPRNIFYSIAVILVMALGWKAYSFVGEALENAALVERQNIVIQLKNSEIDRQKQIAQKAIQAAEIAEKAIADITERQEDLAKVREDVVRSGGDDDGKIAPVLADTLRALRGD